MTAKSRKARSGEAYEDAYEGDPSGYDAESYAGAILEMKDVCLAFGGVRAVADVTFGVKRGAIAGLIGPNGAGKSSLLNVIAGALKPTSGVVLFEGRRVVGRSAHAMARLGITRTFQLSGEFGGLTVLENMLMGARRQRGESLMGALLGPRFWREEERTLVDRARRLLGECDLLAKEDDYARDLSGGQRRILEILRATMADPEVLLLDEPFAGVNKSTARRIEEYLRVLREKGMTMIMVEHELAFVDRLCDDVIVMAQGAVIGRGTMGDLRSSREIRQAYLAG